MQRIFSCVVMFIVGITTIGVSGCSVGGGATTAKQESAVDPATQRTPTVQEVIDEKRKADQTQKAAANIDHGYVQQPVKPLDKKIEAMKKGPMKVTQGFERDKELKGMSSPNCPSSKTVIGPNGIRTCMK